jgi:hypothetical protein
LLPSQIKKLVARAAGGSNEPSTTAQTDDNDNDTTEIPGTEILDRIFTTARAIYGENSCNFGANPNVIYTMEIVAKVRRLSVGTALCNAG